MQRVRALVGYTLNKQIAVIPPQSDDSFGNSVLAYL